jgi:all-trans-retinol 13,14-reductase
MAFNQRVQEVLDEVTPNKKLQKVITGQWGYHGSPPSRAAFAVQALVSRHFVHGAYYPVGGAPEIARQLLRTVAEAGGWTRVRADVEEILIQKGKACGVRLASGEEILAKQIVSAAGIMSTIRRLLPEDAKGPWCEEISALTPAPAHVCLYVGFKGDIAGAGAGPANKWFYDTWDLEAGTWDVAPGEPVPDAPVLYCSFPSLKDPNHDPGPEQHHTGEIVTFVPFETFAPWRGEKWRNRGEEYDAFKDAMKEKLLEQFFKRLPGMEPMLDFAELGTPLSTDHFCRPMKGSIYGIEPTTERYACDHLRAHSPIKNLFFAGCEVGAVGVMGAMAGGMICAMAMEPRKAAGVLSRANKRASASAPRHEPTMPSN